MTRLVWVSRHSLLPENHTILRKAFGEYEVFQYDKTIERIEELIEFANKVHADAYVVVLPPNLIAELIQKDKRPVYRFLVTRTVKDDGSAEFRPYGLEIIKEIRVVTERIV